jgi:hypothetical protein
LKWSEKEYGAFNASRALGLSVDFLSGNEGYDSAPVGAVNPSASGFSGGPLYSENLTIRAPRMPDDVRLTAR